MMRNLVFVLWVSSVFAGLAQAAPDSSGWTSFPLLETRYQGRSGIEVKLTNLSALSVAAYPPKGEPRSLSLAGGTARLTAGKVGNYHWLSAVDDGVDAVRAASSAVYFANPGPAPRDMLAMPKGELEVIPDPLPREHARYRSGEEWPFLVRFHGKPLAGAELVLQTAKGSTSRFTTDPDGVARIRFPDDFGPEAEKLDGHGRPPSAGFVAAVEWRGDQRDYLTAFNGSYAPGGYVGRNLGLGVGFVALGMVLATPLLRRRKERARG